MSGVDAEVMRHTGDGLGLSGHEDRGDGCERELHLDLWDGEEEE